MVEGVTNARVSADVLALGAVLFIQLNDELLEGSVVAIEHLHVLVVAQQLRDCHDCVCQ